LLFKRASDKYSLYIASIYPKDKLFFCRMDLLFRNELINDRYLKDECTEVFNLKSYLIHMILLFISIKNLLKAKICGLKTVHYMIDIKNSNGYYDFRSKEILDLIQPNKTINFMHINSKKYSLFNFNKKSNVIYFESFYEVLKPILKVKKILVNNFSFRNEIKDNEVNSILHKHHKFYSDAYYIYIISKFLFKFLNVEKFISLDDSRYSNELLLITKEMNIFSIGYMHGSFNKYHLGLFNFEYDKYLVWNNYFKDKILNQSNKYQSENIEVVGHFRIGDYLDNVIKKRNILWIGESNINYDEILPFIIELLINGYTIVFRGKPGTTNSLKSFLDEHKIKIDYSKNIFESLNNCYIGLVVGTHSTVLMESWIVGVPSLALKCSYDYGSHLWESNVTKLCLKPELLVYEVEKYFHMSNESIKKHSNKIWGEHYIFNRTKVESIINLNYASKNNGIY